MADIKNLRWPNLDASPTRATGPMERALAVLCILVVAAAWAVAIGGVVWFWS